MSDFNKENTMIPFSEERYKEAKERLAQLDALIDSVPEMKELGLIEDREVQSLQTTRKQVVTFIRLMEKQIPNGK